MKTTYFFRALLLASGLIVGISGCKEATPNAPSSDTTPKDPPGSGDITYELGIIPTEFPSMNIPASNQMTPAKIELGRHLFYDKRLSVDQTVSCASCHDAAKGFADNRSVSPGVMQRKGNRNAMSLVNLGHYENYSWNGRFKTLEEHAPGPIFHKMEMGFGSDDRNNDGYGDPDDDTVILFKTLGKDPRYVDLFTAAYGSSAISIDRIARALASFERTFVSNQSAFDAFNKGNKNALNEYAIRGYKLFTDPKKTNCLSCHNGANFTDGQFHANGISETKTDKGRAELTNESSDVGKFRTPSLRNAALTAPYMHDGTIDDLETVIRRYAEGGDDRTNKDERIKKLELSEQDIADIAEFIKSLTDYKFIQNPALKSPW